MSTSTPAAQIETATVSTVPVETPDTAGVASGVSNRASVNGCVSASTKNAAFGRPGGTSARDHTFTAWPSAASAADGTRNFTIAADHSMVRSRAS
jgi:hypothetical protein